MQAHQLKTVFHGCRQMATIPLQSFLCEHFSARDLVVIANAKFTFMGSVVEGSGNAAMNLYCACFEGKNKISFKGYSPSNCFCSEVDCEIIMKSLYEGNWCFSRGAISGL